MPAALISSDNYAGFKTCFGVLVGTPGTHWCWDPVMTGSRPLVLGSGSKPHLKSSFWPCSPFFKRVRDVIMCDWPGRMVAKGMVTKGVRD